MVLVQDQPGHTQFVFPYPLVKSVQIPSRAYRRLGGFVNRETLRLLPTRLSCGSRWGVYLQALRIQDRVWKIVVKGWKIV